MSDTPPSKVWLITGCSTGFGRETALAALAAGHRVVVTARRAEAIADIIAAYPERATSAVLDVTKAEQIAAATHHALEVFGHIDVLVNNAGYGYLAAIEEGEEAEVRAMFETNFFGLLAMTRAVLPHMRKRRSGTIINISSQAGLIANPTTGYYSSSKYAVEALSESLSKEVASLGIRVCAVAPGLFKTDWTGRSMKLVSEPIDDYAEVAGARREMIVGMHGKEQGDPKKAAAAILMLGESDNPPHHLLLGHMVLNAYRAKLATITERIAQWEELTLDADFPEFQQKR